MEFLDIALVIIDVGVTALGGVALKFGATQKKIIPKLFFVSIGMGSYIGMSFVTVYLYSRYSIVWVQTALAFTYIASPVFAMLILKEKLSAKILLGLLLIVAGVIFVSYGNSIA